MEARPGHPLADGNSRLRTVSTFRTAPELPRCTGRRQARGHLSAENASKLRSVFRLRTDRERGNRDNRKHSSERALGSGAATRDHAGSNRCPYQAEWTAADRPHKLCLLCDARPYRSQSTAMLCRLAERSWGTRPAGTLRCISLPRRGSDCDDAQSQRDHRIPSCKRQSPAGREAPARLGA